MGDNCQVERERSCAKRVDGEFNQVAAMPQKTRHENCREKWSRMGLIKFKCLARLPLD